MGRKGFAVKTPMHMAKEKDTATIGFPYVLEKDQQAVALKKMQELQSSMRSLVVMLENCTKCGNCAKQCHSYLGTEDYYNIPAARAELMGGIYKRYFTWMGRTFAQLTGAGDFDTETLSKWLTYFYQCNLCRRCARFCPFGIDTAEVTIAARHILSELGIMPKFIQGIVANLKKTGNNMGLPKAAILDCAEFLEAEMLEETGLEIKIPLDKPNSDILYIPSSTDFFVNSDTMIGVAKLFYHLGVNWTLSSEILEAANFGLLFNLNVMRDHNQRLKKVANQVGAKLVIQGECGHGWRAAKMYTEGSSGPVSFGLIHILDYCAQHLDQLPLQKLPMRVTLHDPCNYARAGEIIEQPRAILRVCVAEFVEMTPAREDNFCCGGGSGILMDEMMDIRMKLGKKKAEQIRALGKLDYVIAPCASCKAQIPQLLKYYGMNELSTSGVMDLVGKAIILQKK